MDAEDDQSDRSEDGRADLRARTTKARGLTSGIFQNLHGAEKVEGGRCAQLLGLALVWIKRGSKRPPTRAMKG
jgi:hypothetical protein